MEQMNLLVVTPQKVYKEERVDSVSLVTQGGEITLLPHHEELLANVEISVLSIASGGRMRHYAVGGGAVHFKEKENLALLVLHSVDSVDEVDENKALREKREAEEKLKVETSSEEHRAAELSLRRSLNLLAFKRSYKD